MELDRFVARHPRVWHLAMGDAWPGIQQNGLLSAERLVRLYRRPDRDQLLGAKREDPVVLEDPDLGTATLRDQKSLNEVKLQNALLDGMTVEEWLRLLNSYAFFFPTRDAVEQLAKVYDGQEQLVLGLSTSSLVDEFGVWVKLASINTGAVLYNPAKRGKNTYLSVARFSDTKTVKEIVVQEGVPNIGKHLLTAEKRLPDGSYETLFAKQ